MSAQELLRFVIAGRHFKKLLMPAFMPAPKQGIRLRNRAPRSPQQRFETGEQCVAFMQNATPDNRRPQVRLGDGARTSGPGPACGTSPARYRQARRFVADRRARCR